MYITMTDFTIYRLHTFGNIVKMAIKLQQDAVEYTYFFLQRYFFSSRINQTYSMFNTLLTF